MTSPNSFQVLLYYLYVPIADPAALVERQRRLCLRLGLKGRILIAREGLNGTVEGSVEACTKYIRALRKEPGFADIVFKKSEGTGQAFPKLQVRTREEIVTTKLPDPNTVGPLACNTGKYLTAEELHMWIHSDREFYIVDMRNDYEYAVGRFADSILLRGFGNFRELPAMLPQIAHLKNKTVVTVCTGGVRCEKASGVLLEHGFKEVYQLQDGIVTYMEKYPNEDFLGKLYVFDGRMTVAFNEHDSAHQVIGRCVKCGQTSENLVDYYDRGADGMAMEGRRHNIVCRQCIAAKKIVLDREQAALLNLEKYRHLNKKYKVDN